MQGQSPRPGSVTSWLGRRHASAARCNDPQQLRRRRLRWPFAAVFLNPHHITKFQHGSYMSSDMDNRQPSIARGHGGMQAMFPSILGPGKQDPGDLTGKTAIITGGSKGIGYEISLSFATAGAKVIMLSRKEEAAQEAVRRIRDQKPDAQVDWVELDLGDLMQTLRVVSTLAETTARLDLLILDAGFMREFAETDDGIERSFQVNWLSQFLIFNRFLPLLRRTSRLPGADVRVIVVASEHHRFCPSSMHFGSLEEINNPDIPPSQLYGRTKAANIIGVKYGFYEKVLKKYGDDIVTVAVHPGSVATDFHAGWHDYSWGELMEQLQTRLIDRSPEQGAYSTIYAATSPEVHEKRFSGSYLNDPGSPGKETPQCSDPILGMALWDLSNRLVSDKLGSSALLSWGPE